MSLTNKAETHSLKTHVKFHLSYMPGIKDAYITWAVNDAMLDIEQVCAALQERGGFTGNYDDLVFHVKCFLNEAAYQLHDGHAVNMGHFSIHPPVG